MGAAASDTRQAVDGADFAERLEAALALHWPVMQGRLQGAGGDGLPVTAGAETIAGYLDRFAAHHPDEDYRAVASLWVQWYLVTSWPVLAFMALYASEVPKATHSRIAVDDSGTPRRLSVARARRLDGPAAALDALYREHGAALFGALSRVGGISVKLPWSNASSVLAWSFEQLTGVVDEPERRAAEAALYWPRDTRGRRNPLYRPAPDRRRVCCLRYRLDGHGYCRDCPIDERHR